MRTHLLLAIVTLTGAASAQTNVTGWHAAGQTWIVWDDTPPMPSSVRIYASTTDFVAAGDVSAGVEVGRLLPSDWRGFRLNVALPGATYRLPSPGGGTTSLASNQGVFAFTSHVATTLHFAVVPDGVTAVTAANATGPIAQTLDPVEAHWQGSRPTPGSGQTMHVYAHWVDGHADHASGRPDYPVMGNASMNGCASVFMVTEPLSGPPVQDAPLVVGLHGGGGLFMNFVGGASPNIGLTYQDALLLTPDGTINTVMGTVGSAWLGFWEGFDRFTFPFAYPLPDDATVVDYTTRKLLWQLDQVAAMHPVDLDRVSLIGHSGGARGAGMLARVYPERFAAAILHIPPLKTGDQNVVFGDATQNLTTTLPGGHGVADLAKETFFPAAERDLPVTKLVIGRNDVADPWTPEKVAAYHDVDATRMGRQLFFDERGHGSSQWSGAYFNGTAMLAGESVLRHSRTESYPGFFGDDHEPSTPGTQPDMGDGTPSDGDPYGTYGGYYDWDPSTLVDDPTRWACTFWLNGTSTNPNDNFPGVVAEVGLTIRRPQVFQPVAGQTVLWRLLRVSDGALLQSGSTIVEADGLVAVDGLLVTKDPDRVRVIFDRDPAAALYGDGCAGSGAFVPLLYLLGKPQGGQPVTLHLDHGPGGGSVLLVFGPGAGQAPIGFGCDLLVAPLLPLVLGPLPLSPGGSGEGTLALPAVLPASASGLVIHIQALTVDGGVPAGFAASNGLALAIQ